MTMGHSFWTAMLFVGAFCQTAPAEDIGCSIPSVKKGGNTTLTCSFPVSDVSVGTMVTVNGRLFAPSDKGPDLAVLSLEMTKEGWGQPIIHPRFKFRNISIADGKWRVFIDLSNATYRDEGVYICQLAGTPDHQECSFVLDRVKLTINNTSLLLHVDLHDVDDERKQHYLIKRVQHRTGQVLKNDTLPKPADNFTLKLKSDRKYKVAVYMGESHIPVTRSICIPTVRELQTTTMKSGGVRVDWKLGPVCNDHVAMSDKYRYQVCSQEADSVVPLQDNCFDRHIRAATIRNLTVGSKCMYGVRVAFNSGGHGPLTTLEADILPYKPEANESSPWDVGYVMLAIAVCGGLIVFALKNIVKRLKRKEGDGHIGDLLKKLLAKKAAIGEPEPDPDMGVGPSLGEVAGHQDSQPAGPTSGTVLGTENRPQDLPYVEAEVHPIATPVSGSINNEPAGATQNTSLALDVPPMEVPNSQEEHIVSTEPEVSSSEEAGHDLTPDSGCEQETEAKRELRKSYQDLASLDMQAKLDEINQLKQKVQESDDELKAMREKCAEIKRDSRQQLADKEKDLKITTERQQGEHRRELDREKTKMNNRISKLTDEVKESGKKLKDSKHQCSELQLLLEERNKQLKNLQEKYEEAKRQSDKRITDLETNVSLCMLLIASKDREAQENVRRSEQQLQEASAELCRSRQRIEELESEYTKLQNELSIHEQLIKKLRHDPPIMQSFQLLEERVHSLTVQQHEQAQQLQAMPQKMMKDLEEKLIRLDPGTPTQHKYSDNTLNKKDEEGATGGSELGSPEPSGTEFQRNRTPFTQDRSFPQYIKFQEFSQMEGPLSIRLDRPRGRLRGDGYDLNQPLQAGHSSTSAQGIQRFKHVSPQAQSDDAAAYVSGPQSRFANSDTQSEKTEGSTTP